MADILGNGGVQFPLAADDTGYNDSVAGHTSMAESLTGHMSPSHEIWLEQLSQNRINALFDLLQQNDSEFGALDMLKELAKTDEAYREIYLQALAERENNVEAWKRYEEFNRTYYQRSTEDLKKAGLNPWLALQNLGSGGTGSVSSAGTWSSSAYGNKASMKNAQASSNKVITGILGVVMAALIYAML